MNIATPALEVPGFEAWSDLEAYLKASKLPEGHFHRADLEDEDRPNGTVVIRDRAGVPVAWMSHAAFEGFLKAASEQQAKLAPPVAPFKPPARSNRHQRRAAAAKARKGKP